MTFFDTLVSKVLTEQDLKSLDTYEYHSGSYTPLDNFLSPYYGKLIEYFPRNIAPNTITIIGLLFSISSVICVCFFDPDMSGNAPQWVYLYASIANMLYAILDCLDGKQARRIKASSPLGQMFDHGCDSLNTAYILMCAISTLGLGQDFICPYMFTLSMTVFASAQLCEYFSGILYCGTSWVGVSELLIIISLTYLFAGLFSNSFFKESISNILPFITYPITIGSFAYSILVVFFVFIAIYILTTDLIHGTSVPDHLKGTKNLSRWDYFGRILSLLEITICSIYVLSSSYHVKYLIPLLLLSGTTFSLFSTRCNIFHLTRKYLSPFYFGCVPITIFAILLYTKHDSVQALYYCLACIVFLYLSFILASVNLIKNHLHISVFHVIPKDE